MSTTLRRIRGFSLIELVIVIVILGVIGAIAIPRMSRGAAGAAESALVADLSTIRRAIELYTAEHEGLIPKDKSTLIPQLTMYSDIDGNTNATRTSVFSYGPYLRVMPALPVGNNKGASTIHDGGNPGDGSEGWWYDKQTGAIVANTKNAEVDSNGTAYNTY